ncbi:Sulfhydryl oxidase 1-like Protein [Tribolium castaneum]|uniref:Sulfhydryl oxidase n=1 Tax=Tribolium castaneum TaxID=7070 RepID=A0A139WDJ7_TRICA|nr:PREDICTED: sulfhydryl oxidase 2-like [Tribolium castaneum]KYB26006.1 Sulfhydryl oxidase 1-like Protein [Tribolium castaneum]|eukprot:XP_015838004.1 PREDICTED: sulfhydryl oxidase 2-like [Tribolium castaneum]
MLKPLALLLVLAGSQCAPLGDLYLPDDDVEILTIENFKRYVENSTSAWLVEFYASWCGYCQRFAPPWKQFATEAAPWRDLVRVAVLECSDEINTPICRDFGIVKYPTVRYFHENSHFDGGDKGVIVPREFPVTVDAIKKNVIERFMTEMGEGRGVVYPNLLPYLHSDLEPFFDEEDDDIFYGFLVVEDSDSYLGGEVALDLHKTPNVTIRHALNNNTKLVKNLQIGKFPTLVIIDRNNNTQIVTENIEHKKELKATIADYLAKKGLKVCETTPEKKGHLSLDPHPDPKQRSRTLLRQKIKKMGDAVFQMDLETSLRYALLREVSTTKVIKGEQLAALRAFLNVIKKYFPFGYNSTSFINNLTNLTSSDEVQGVQVQVLVQQADDSGVFSTPQRFLGCQGSANRFRGYPCSLWRLFHYLTVNSVLLNVSNRKANPVEVLGAMHGYVKHFFSCSHCSEHFQKMAAERNLTSVSSLEESVLWLWEAHNVVNKRLKGDTTEDPEYPKEQFPTRLRCPECYGEDGTWRKKEVLKYLKRMYGRYSVRYVGSDTKVLFPGLDR